MQPLVIASSRKVVAVVSIFMLCGSLVCGSVVCGSVV